MDKVKTSVVLCERRGHVAIITLNRPKARNAVNQEVSLSMERILDELEADDNIWVYILTANHPKVFCAGADLKAINSGKPVFGKKGGFAGLVQYPRKKPMIAAVDGYALAGGFEIVLSCDLVVASTKSKFGVPEVKRSLIAAAGGLFRISRKLPQNIAMELILTGDHMSAEKALEFGLLNELVQPGEALNAALRLAERITVNAPLAVRESRQVVVESEFMDDKEAFNRSNRGLMEIMKTPDFREGPLAFIQKRKPRWTGKIGRAKL